MEIPCSCGLKCERVVDVHPNSILQNQISIEISGVDGTGEEEYAYITLNEVSIEALIRELKINLDIIKSRPKVINLNDLQGGVLI